MKILTLWLWAFWFAINKLLWENNPEITFFAYEKSEEISKKVSISREHPYFFKWNLLPDNIEVINNYDDIISEVDLLILAIPAQYISLVIENIKSNLKNWLVILNLAKGIDVSANAPISRIIQEKLVNNNYIYSILSWWMIASELVEWKMLWADLWIADSKIWNSIKLLFKNYYLDIKLREDIINIELYWSLKNIVAIYTWYYEWLWYDASSVWFKFTWMYEEIKKIMPIYWWNENIDFSYYSLWWDLIATCFWWSRNRYFWQLLWEWKTVDEALEILKSEKKHAEWYETLKAVYEKIKEKDWFKNIKFLYSLMK